MRSGYDTEEIKRVSDIRNRWYGNYYLTNDQYEGAKKDFETKINSPNNLDTSTTSTTLQINPSTDVRSTTKIDSPIITTPHIVDCGPTCVSNIVGEYIGVIFHDLEVKRIIFNPPATVIIWEDDTKTVVKCAEDDEFNPEIGVAMCYMKKIYGSRHAFSKKVESYIEE